MEYSKLFGDNANKRQFPDAREGEGNHRTRPDALSSKVSFKELKESQCTMLPYSCHPVPTPLAQTTFWLKAGSGLANSPLAFQ
ncbi:hypothetical protein TcWFU_008206 [Taenia crassiceps]|uniref:Uncharacterized protein n=1 Tax=Taenia crassiceps TaxID=6207 RepID=A0ABR4PZR9_9CEST